MRICRAKRVKLACKRQAAKIFTQSVNTPIPLTSIFREALAISPILCYTNLERRWEYDKNDASYIVDFIDFLSLRMLFVV